METRRIPRFIVQIRYTRAAGEHVQKLLSKLASRSGIPVCFRLFGAAFRPPNQIDKILVIVSAGKQALIALLAN